MKFGLLTAILEGTTFEEAVDFAAENQLECLEVACWPNTGGAKRRYAGVCHIDAEALTEEKAKELYIIYSNSLGSIIYSILYFKCFTLIFIYYLIHLRLSKALIRDS